MTTETTTKPKRTPKVSEMPAAELLLRHKPAAYWFGQKWCPGVDKRDGGGYQIRVCVREFRRGQGTTTTYEYFEIDDGGLILAGPRGYAKDYNRRVRLTGLDDAVAEHATPDETAQRLNFGFGI